GRGGVIKLAVNGKVVSGVSKCSPRKGYLALESEGSECHFRNLKIKELPSTNPKPEEVADQDRGFVNLYTGLDLSGWQAPPAKNWQPRDWVLDYAGKGGVGEGGRVLRGGKEGGRVVTLVLRPPRKRGGKAPPAAGVSVRAPPVEVTAAGAGKVGGKDVGGEKEVNRGGKWNRLHVTVKG